MKKLKLREIQDEAINKIIKAFNRGVKNIVLKAPTGSGKSIIALEVSRILDCDAYILTNEFFLQQQYTETIRDYKYDADIIASAHQYTCGVNKQNVKTLAECKLAGLSLQRTWAEASCARGCDFFINRFTTPLRQSVITNYAYFFKMMNYTYRQLGMGKEFEGLSRYEIGEDPYVVNGKLPPIIPRHLVIADESHRLGEAAQSYFSFTVDLDLVWGLRDCMEAVFGTGEWIPLLRAKWGDFSKLVHQLLKQPLKDPKKHLTILKEIRSYLVGLKDLSDKTGQHVTQNWGGEIENGRIKGSNMPGEVRDLLNFVVKLEELECRIDDYIQLLNETSLSNFVVNYDSHTARSYKFYSEDELLNFTFFPWSEKRIFMSATIGDPDDYIKRFGLNREETEVIEIDPNWNYDKSKILFTNTTNFKHSNTEIAQIEMLGDIKKIINLHKEEAGIIHTTTYDNALFISNNIKNNRISIYRGTEEKRELVKMVKGGKLPKNTILVGPSLKEGLDLPGNLCRFQILLKVPYPFLGDQLWAKRNYSKDRWIYLSQPIFDIIQTIGRGIRYRGDWCTTYLLDKRFEKYIKSKQNYLPDDFIGRFDKVKL